MLMKLLHVSVQSGREREVSSGETDMLHDWDKWPRSGAEFSDK